MRANWSSRKVLVIVVVDDMSTLMAGCNDDNDICIVNAPLQRRYSRGRRITCIVFVFPPPPPLWKLTVAIKSPGPAFTSDSFNFEELSHGGCVKQLRLRMSVIETGHSQTSICVVFTKVARLIT